MPEALPPGSVIGILGGGQLGRMLAIAAARLGFACHIYEPAAAAPAADVARAWTRAAWEDEAALAAFADGVDVVTYEFENVPVATARFLEARKPVRPGPRALEIARDRLDEKRFLNGLGLTTAPFADIDGPDGIGRAIAATGLPAILKTRRMGYDGKGQVRVASEAEARAALARFGGTAAILEGVVAFNREVSVIGVRGLDGAVVCYDPAENRHEAGILRESRVPAALSRREANDAVLASGRILNALDYVGVIGVEFFAAKNGLYVNEFAPRVHNSGHWTIEACRVDQFQNHIRAIAGWPLGDGARQWDATMTNLIGDACAAWRGLAAEDGVALHLYGKAEVRPGRKMGHVTRLLPRT
jgi:5-(carboxyamino)imidazole ribonucleotide synthase